jgi:serine/threonine protein kinase
MYDTQAEIDAFFRCLYQFKPIKKLGQGNFGLAILVYDEVEGRRKVFKLPKDERTTEALRKEGEHLRKLSEELLDPHIIRLHQYGKVVMEWNGVEQERYYLNMAFGGTSLRSKLGDYHVELDEYGNPQYHGSGRRLPIDEALRIAIDVCQGLESLHGFRGAAYRLIHRDIKPENLLIDDDTGIARIADFGISRVIERSSALVSFAGTLIYMDSECFKGRASVQSDLYSLGVVMYEMLTGELPFFNFEQRLKGLPTPPHALAPEIPKELSECILRTLENDVAARYPDASELLADLRRVQAARHPLGDRYERLGTLDDGRFLCKDKETGAQVAVRIVATTASLTEFAAQVSLLEQVSPIGIELPQRQFRNEQFIGIVSAIPRGPHVNEEFQKISQGIARLERLCEIVAAACGVLSAAHEAGVCHGFLSPYAITVAGGRVQVHDLGNSPIFRARRLAGHSEASLGGLESQIPYLSPQMLAATHDPSPADDVYALGAILYSLAVHAPGPGQTPETGAEPFPLQRDERQRLLRGEAVPEPSLNPRGRNDLIPPRLATIIARALRWNPHDRFATVAEMAEALRACRWPDDSVIGLVSQALETYPLNGTDDELLEACRLIDYALEIDLGNVEAHRARGIIYFRNRSYRFAIEELETVSQIAPTAETWDLIGQSHMQLPDQHDEAIHAYSKALELHEDPCTLDRLARAYHAAGKPDEALKRLRQSIALESDESLRERRKALLKEWTGDGVSPHATDPKDDSSWVRDGDGNSSTQSPKTGDR